jgi:NadR type nicotinamide-nucleotide adenylyltransferase
MAISNGSAACKSSLMKIKEKPLIVVITGAESTGKSVLTKQLSQHFLSHFYPEYAREYLGKYGPGYTRKDVENIARVQLQQMKEATGFQTTCVFFDTWLIITKVWFEVVYGNVPDWLPEAISNAPVDLFLLCENDIPWIPDPLRENGGEMREKLFEMYKTNIMEFGFSYRTVTGIGDDRLKNAINAVGDYL